MRIHSTGSSEDRNSIAKEHSSHIVAGHTHDNRQVVVGIQGNNCSSFVVMPIAQSEEFLAQFSHVIEKLRAVQDNSTKP